jgi:hypothetical protein
MILANNNNVGAKARGGEGDIKPNWVATDNQEIGLQGHAGVLAITRRVRNEVLQSWPKVRTLAKADEKGVDFSSHFMFLRDLNSCGTG